MVLVEEKKEKKDGKKVHSVVLAGCKSSDWQVVLVEAKKEEKKAEPRLR